MSFFITKLWNKISPRNLAEQNIRTMLGAKEALKISSGSFVPKLGVCFYSQRGILQI
jgi:hypothetical protein